jgi:hypothetical protein
MRIRDVAPIVLLASASFIGCQRAADENPNDRPEAISLSEDRVQQQVEVPPGTLIQIRLDQQLSPRDNKSGDAFTGDVVSPIEIDGRTAIPAKARVHGRVTAVERADDLQGATVLKLDFTSLEIENQPYALDASLTQAHPKVESKTGAGETAAKIGASAAGGAILGRILGGDAKSSALGAIAGAAAGTAIVLGTQDAYAVLPAGSVIELRTEEPLHIDS